MPPKPQTWRGSNRHLTHSMLQVKGCTAETYRLLLGVVVQGPCREFGSTFLYDVRLPSYGASKLPNFRILAYFYHTKRLATKLNSTSSCVAMDTDATQLSSTIGNATVPVEQRTANLLDAGQSCFCSQCCIVMCDAYTNQRRSFPEKMFSIAAAFLHGR